MRRDFAKSYGKRKQRVQKRCQKAKEGKEEIV